MLHTFHALSTSCPRFSIALSASFEYLECSEFTAIIFFSSGVIDFRRQILTSKVGSRAERVSNDVQSSR